MSENSESVPLSLRLTGPNVTKEMMEETGQHLVALTDAICEAKGLPAGMFVAGEPRIACDTEDCDSSRAWDDEGHGWVRTVGGLDYCPGCIVTKGS